MKIVRVVNELRDGGVQIRLARVPRHPAARAHELTVVCTEAEGPNAARVRDGGACVETLAMKPEGWDDPRYWLALASLFRRLRPDVVHSHMFRQNVPATIAARLARVPRIFAQVHLVNTYKRRSWIRAERLLSRARTATLAVSQAVADDIAAAVAPWTVPRLRVLYNGVHLEAFRGIDREHARRDLRAELGFAADATIVVNLARLHAEKNQLQLVDAFARLAPEFPRAVLLLAGEGEARADIEARVARHGLAKRVALPGQRSDVPRLLAACDIFALPSIQEGFSNAILEAMASALPVVASDAGGAREQLGPDGTGGFVTPVRDGAALEAALRCVLANPDDARAMGERNRGEAERFSHETMIRETLELYAGRADSRSSS